MVTAGNDQIGFKTGTSTAGFHVVRHERIPPRPGVSEPWPYKWFVDGVQQTPTNIDYWKNNGYIDTDGKTIKKRVPEREYRRGSSATGRPSQPWIKVSGRRNQEPGHAASATRSGPASESLRYDAERGPRVPRAPRVGYANDTGRVRAVTRSAYGGPSVLTVAEIATPKPAAHEILVRVHATTVNRTDCAILRAKPFVMRFGTGLRRPKSPVPGTDFAGEVVQTGFGVTEYAAGDRVWGFNDNGLASQAQFLAIAQDAAIAKIPPGIDDAQAAASAEAAHYALNALKRVGYVPGQRVCVYGATGAIGSAAVQLLAAQGSEVTAFCRDQHADIVRSLGARTVVDYTTQDLATYPDRFDLVFDAVGKTTFAASKPLLGDSGRYVSSELGPHGQNLYLPLTTRLRPGPTVHFPLPTGRRLSIRHMTRLLADGRFRPLIDRHFPLEDVRSAYEYVLTGQKLGNVILDVP